MAELNRLIYFLFQFINLTMPSYINHVSVMLHAWLQLIVRRSCMGSIKWNLQTYMQQLFWKKLIGLNCPQFTLILWYVWINMCVLCLLIRTSPRFCQGFRRTIQSWKTRYISNVINDSHKVIFLQYSSENADWLWEIQ